LIWATVDFMKQTIQQSRQIVIRRLFIAQLSIVAAFCVLAIVGYFWHVGSFLFGVFLGSLGGSIALLKRVRSDKAVVIQELAEDITSTLMPILYGGLMAGVGYLLFMSGILSGEGGSGLFTSNLFPNFTTPENLDEKLIKNFIQIKPETMKDVGKLLVWCFIAGYSERFVTGILKQLEQRGEEGDKA